MAPVRGRLDAELVRRGLARSRAEAAELVSAGRVSVSGSPALKVATQVERAAAIEVQHDEDGPPGGEPGSRTDSDGHRWASRGAQKLLGALEDLGVDVAGRRCLDAGASTGGFSHVLLDRGAASVVAVDVGYGQLAHRVASDARVTVLDRTNVRDLGPEQVGEAPEVVVADLSFIPLHLVLPALRRVSAPGARFVLMVKPQFEVGRERLPRGGVVRDDDDRERAVLGVVTAGAEVGLVTRGVAPSRLPGPSGNVEFFLLLEAGDDTGSAAGDVRAAVTAGRVLG